MRININGGFLDFELEEDKSRFLWSVSFNGITTKDITMLLLPIDKKVLCSVSPVDSRGNPAEVKDLEWSSSNPEIVEVQAVEEEVPPPGEVQPTKGKKTAKVYQAWVIPTIRTGECQINVTADADLGPNVVPIYGTLEVEVVGGQAIGFAITHSEPEANPEARK